MKTENKEAKGNEIAPGVMSPHCELSRPDAVHIQFKQHVVSDDIDTLSKFNKVTSGPSELLGYS